MTRRPDPTRGLDDLDAPTPPAPADMFDLDDTRHPAWAAVRAAVHIDDVTAANLDVHTVEQLIERAVRAAVRAHTTAVLRSVADMIDDAQGATPPAGHRDP